MATVMAPLPRAWPRPATVGGGRACHMIGVVGTESCSHQLHENSTASQPLMQRLPLDIGRTGESEVSTIRPPSTCRNSPQLQPQ